MEFEHLADDELDLELLIRGTKEIKGLDRQGKVIRLCQLSRNKSSALPTASNNIMSDVDNIYQCQARLQNILQTVESSFRQNNADQLKICRSRLMHYQLRLSLITDSFITANANKSLAKIKQILARIQDFMLHQPSTNPDAKEDIDILPGDRETLQRLRDPLLQSSVKESQQQPLIEDREQQPAVVNQQAQGQVEDEKQDLHQEQQIIAQQQQLLRQQQERQYWEQCRQQQEQIHQQQLQQFQQQQQELQHLLQQERTKRQQIENQMGLLQHRQQEQYQQHPNVSQHDKSSPSVNWPLDYPGQIPPHAIPGVDQLPHDLRNDFMRFLRSQNRPNTPRSGGQVQNSARFTQPVHKWPFEYSGQPNIIQLGEFLNQVNTFADTEGIDEQTLLRSIKHLLKGRALQWYTRSYLYLTSWETFRLEIKQEFLPPNYSEIIKQDLYLRFQGSNESFTSFYRDLVAAFEIVEPAISESEKLFIVKSHLNPDYSPIAAASRARSIKELVVVCKDFEVSRSYAIRGRSSLTPRTYWPKQETSSFQRASTNRTENPSRQILTRQPFHTAQLNMMELNREEEDDWNAQEIREHEAMQQDIALRNETAANVAEEVNAVRLQNNFRDRQTTNSQNIGNGEQRSRELASTIICWQCENPGHTYPNCPNQKLYIFCYSCGKKGCTTRNCEACISRWKQLDSSNVSQQSGNRRWENPQ
ncbi:uncharacterized protein LOC129728873 [Wyeomyia smithii]|uniref:uncharacterized protein LOC129728873 n=1 Tax=Wyeomyia smithii TaxID=174621 RepID=UPI002467F822|nr:uncharacterized protein LOC129728873 [Wyeomyia smithii]